MKKLCFKGLALFALIIVLAACSNPADTPTPAPYTPLSISGRFTTDEGTAYFKAQEGSGTAASIQRAVARAVSATEVAISGTLDDGDITFRLKGFYDKESGAYTLQAASSIIKYSITGTAGGGTTASVATRDGAEQPFGEPTIVQVDTEISGAVLDENMTSPPIPDEDIAEGLTRDGVSGVWYEDTSGGEYKYVVNEWGITGMVKVEGLWVEDDVMGFSKIEEKEDGSIDVIGDATSTMYTPPDPAKFGEYLEREGYSLFNEQNFELPDAFNIFRNENEINGHTEIDGLLAEGDNRYVVKIYYDPSGWSQGEGEKPFYVHSVEQESANEDDRWPIFVNKVDPITADTLEEILPMALAAIREKTGDDSVDYVDDTKPFWTYTTEGVLMSAAMQEWDVENPVHELEGDELQAHWDARQIFMKGQLHEHFPDRFPTPEKIIFEGSQEWSDLEWQYLTDEDEMTFKVTILYYKWNVVEENGGLTIKAYTSDGTINTMFAANYTAAEGLSQPMEEPLATLRR